MKAISQEVYEGIVAHIQKQMEVWEGVYITKDGLPDIAQIAPYEEYLQSIPKRGKKVHVKQFLTDDWKKFWNTWPSTKSVPDTQYKSGAKMKGPELKMHGKWYEAIEKGAISQENMLYAAKCYLAWAYHDSKKNKKNELQYRNGMEPWLNQEQYLIYAEIDMPEETESSIYTEA